MLLRLLLSCLIAGMSNFLYAQDNAIYSMLPVCNKEKQMLSLLKGSRSVDEVLYVFHFKPNSCPRCEGIIEALAKELTTNNKATALVVDVNNKTNGEAHISKFFSSSNFKRIIYDTNKVFRSFIDYEKSKLNVPFLYKIDLKSGRFYNLMPMLGVDLNDAFYARVVTDSTFENCTSNSIVSESNSVNNTFWQKITTLKDNKYPIEDPNWLKSDGRYVYFVDYGTENVYIYARNGAFISSLYPVDSEYYSFAKNDEEKNEITNLRKEGIARVIYLNIRPDSGKVLISSSLPKINITYNESKTDTNVGYFNMATLVSKSFDNKILKIDTFNVPLVDKPGFVIDHYMYRAVDNNNMYALSLRKGWPAVGTLDRPQDSLSNPFLTPFYEDVPVIRLYDNGHRLLGEFGRLAKIYREKQLGYHFRNVNVASSLNNLYIVDQTAGELQVVTLKDVRVGLNRFKTYQLFPDKEKGMANAKPDTFSNKLQYIRSFKGYLFKKYIMDINSFDDRLYIVYIDKEEKKLVVQVFNEGGDSILNSQDYSLQDANAIKAVSIIKDNTGLKLLGIEQIDKKKYVLTECKLPF